MFVMTPKSVTDKTSTAIIMRYIHFHLVNTFCSVFAGSIPSDLPDQTCPQAETKVRKRVVCMDQEASCPEEGINEHVFPEG